MNKDNKDNKDKLKLQLLSELNEAASQYPTIGASSSVEYFNDDKIHTHQEYTLDIEGALVTVSKDTHYDKTVYTVTASIDNECPVYFSSDALPSDLYQQVYNKIRNNRKKFNTKQNNKNNIVIDYLD